MCDSAQSNRLVLECSSEAELASISGVLRFGGVGSWGSGANLAIWNWSGTTQSGFATSTEIIAVPEPETYLYALILLTGIVIQYLRRRAKLKPSEGHRPA